MLLIAFTTLTYAAAPVAGFGWLLTAMGLAQRRSTQYWLRLAYLGGFALVFIYSETPVLHIVLAALAP